MPITRQGQIGSGFENRSGPCPVGPASQFGEISQELAGLDWPIVENQGNTVERNFHSQPFTKCSRERRLNFFTDT